MQNTFIPNILPTAQTSNFRPLARPSRVLQPTLRIGTPPGTENQSEDHCGNPYMPLKRCWARPIWDKGEGDGVCVDEGLSGVCKALFGVVQPMGRRRALVIVVCSILGLKDRR